MLAYFIHPNAITIGLGGVEEHCLLGVIQSLQFLMYAAVVQAIQCFINCIPSPIKCFLGIQVVLVKVFLTFSSHMNWNQASCITQLP